MPHGTRGFLQHSRVVCKYSYSCSPALNVFSYAGGFVLMTPQLVINHKLKSVAHLPWKFLCFRFINTFIDGNIDFL